MIRLLHLLDAQPDYQTRTGVLHLARNAPDIAPTVRTLGRSGDDPSLLRAVMSLRRGRESSDLIHAWGEQALLAAALASDSSKLIVYSPNRFPTRSSLRLARAIAATRNVQVISSTDTTRREFVTRGLPIEQCHLIRPGVDFARIKSRRDPALRAALGFSSDDYVMLAPGESTREMNHDLAVWTASILHVLNPRFRLLLWGNGPLIDHHQRLATRMGQRPMLAIANRALQRSVEFEELPAAADVALITAMDPIPPLPISTVMASGMPIVSVVTQTIAELLEDRHTALFVRQPTSRALAQRILDLHDDSQFRWSLSDMARTEAYEYFSMTRFVEQHRAIYRQLAAGKPVQIPQQAPGAGLRFHGRA